MLTNYLYISFVGVEIVVGLLAHGESEHHNEWPDIGNEEPDPQNFDELG